MKNGKLTIKSQQQQITKPGKTYGGLVQAHAEPPLGSGGGFICDAKTETKSGAPCGGTLFITSHGPLKLSEKASFCANSEAIN
ncbi:MAG: hypothetical protein AAF770_03535 [Bacteroidota bacterium]